MRTPAEELQLERAEVLSIETSESSLMPEGILDALKPNEVVDLFGYLMLSSATLGDGVRRVARYQAVLTGRSWA